MDREIRKRESIKLLIQLFNIDQFSLKEEEDAGEGRRSENFSNEVFELLIHKKSGEEEGK